MTKRKNKPENDKKRKTSPHENDNGEDAPQMTKNKPQLIIQVPRMTIRTNPKHLPK